MCAGARHIASVSCSRLMISEEAQQSRLEPRDDGQQSPAKPAAAQTWLRLGLGLGLGATDRQTDRPADRRAGRRRTGR